MLLAELGRGERDVGGGDRGGGGAADLRAGVQVALDLGRVRSDISHTSPLYVPYISPVSPLYLPISPLYLAISPQARAASRVSARSFLVFALPVLT